MERWKNYFNQLLNLKEGGVTTSINTIEEDLEPYILKSEIEDAVKTKQQSTRNRRNTNRTNKNAKSNRYKVAT